MIPLDVPITLGRDEARRQLEAELAKPDYLNPQSSLNDWLSRFLDWLTDGSQTAADQGDARWLIIVVAVVVLAALVAVVWIAGPLRRDRRIKPQGMFDDAGLTAADLRDEATRLGGDGQWTQATIQRFRALIRALGERGVIEENQGMTAHEAAGRARVRLPSFGDALDDAARVFDELAYGDRTGTKAQYDRMTALDQQAQKARPLVAPQEAALSSDAQPGSRVTTDVPPAGAPRA